MNLAKNKKLAASIAVNVLLAVALSILLHLVYPQFVYELDSVDHWTRYSVRTYRNWDQGTAYFEVLVGFEGATVSKERYREDAKGELSRSAFYPVIANWSKEKL